MISQHALTFQWTPWSIGLSAAAIAASGAVGFLAWRRSGFRPLIGLLEALRLTAVAAIAVLLNQPEWIEEYRPSTKPTVAVLWDDTASMQTRDVERAGTATAATRREAAARLAQPATWSALSDRLQVAVESFNGGSAAHAPGSDLHSPLLEASEKHENLLAIVLISDGDWNAGSPPVEAAAHLRLQGTPVYTVPVGSPTRLPDVELLSVDAPTFGVAGKSVRVPVTIESSLPREYLTTLQLKTSDGVTVSKEVRIAAMGRTIDAISWKPADTGDLTVAVSIPRHRDEVIENNNERSAPIAIRDEQLKVLVVEAYPRWEYRYLRNALSRDPGVEATCLLFHPGLSKPGGGTRDYIDQFPGGLDELAQYDVVFLGDVGLDDGQLNEEDCRLLKGLVEHQASGLVFMPGWQGRQASLRESALDDLYPVELDASQPGGWGSRSPNHFELTESGRLSLLTKLADTQNENTAVWQSLPGFQWYAPVLRARVGTAVLAVHQTEANQYGRLPLLVTKTYGAGKVLFMGSDGAWRWRKGVEDKYHYRFWGQVVRWMAYQRNMAKGETMRLYYAPDQPQIGQTLVLNANVMEPSGEPLTEGDVTARIVPPSGRTQTVRFASTGDQWGAFAAQLTPEEPGKHKVTVSCKQTGRSLEAALYVQGGSGESIGRAARSEVLTEIARVTRGAVFSPEKAGEISNLLATLPDPPPAVRRLQLWSHPVATTCVVGLLALFWSLRKMAGLV